MKLPSAISGAIATVYAVVVAVVVQVPQLPSLAKTILAVVVVACAAALDTQLPGAVSASRSDAYKPPPPPVSGPQAGPGTPS